MKIDGRAIIERFNRLDDRIRLSIFGILLLMLFMFDIYFLGLPQYNGINAINNQIKTLAADTLQVMNDKQRIDQFKKSLEDTRLRYEVAYDRLRSVQDIPNILATVSRVAYDNGVKVDKLMPLKNKQEVVKTDFPGRYDMIPIIVEVHCPYHRFGRFLSKLQEENFYFFLSDMVVANDDKRANSRLFSLTIDVIVADKETL